VDEDLRTELELMVRGGFQSRDEILKAIREIAGDEGADLGDEESAAAVDAAIAAWRDDAQTWPAVTDNDRLDRGFARLSAAGVIARQDFACCTSCAHAEIWDEVEDQQAWRGYVWFHRQDTERAVAGDGLYLGFGGRDDRPRWQRLFGGRGAADARSDATAIGHEVVRALSDEGLRVTWDGKIDRRILVDPFAWRRRPA
jgi:hypothetical protein